MRKIFWRVLDRAIWPLLALALLAGAPTARAVEVHGLYSATVPVSGQGKQERARALVRALREVVVKVSGTLSAATNPLVVQALAHPERLLQQFSYGEKAPSAGPVPASGTPPAAPAAPTLTLRADFDPVAIDALLRQGGLPVWGRTRPQVLLWLAVQRDGVEHLIGSEDASGLAQELQSYAARRGIPLDLPLLDLEDTAKVSAATVWNGDGATVAQASARYGAEAVVMVRAFQPTPGLWEAQWTLLIGDSQQTWTTQGDAIELALGDGIDRLADDLAARFAVAETMPAGAGIELSVAGVRDLADFARTLRYFASLQMVRGVEVEELDGDRMRLRVDARASEDALANVIALGHTLVRSTGGSGLAFELQR